MVPLVSLREAPIDAGAPVVALALPSRSAGLFAVRLDCVISPEESTGLISETEARGYVAALLNAGGGRQVLDASIRDSGRCMVDDAVASANLWSRIKHAVPLGCVPGMVPVGLNERLRFLRYDGGQCFQPHMDGVYERPDGVERSALTLLLYLNADYEGAFTTFLHGDWDFGAGDVAISPATGTVVLHEHRILHGVPPLTLGRKYVVRTDVMFRPA